MKEEFSVLFSWERGALVMMNVSIYAMKDFITQPWLQEII